MSVITVIPRIKIDEEILWYLQTEEKRTTIVHCRIHSPFPTLARIWSTTYLLEESGNKISLIKAFNISMAHPNGLGLTQRKASCVLHFYSTGLAKNVKRFN